MAITKGIVGGSNYSFNAAAKTITFSSDYLGMSLSDITYITNIKSGVATVIYDPFDTTKGGVLNGLTLTLAYNTVAMSDSDPLQIIVGFTPNTSTPQNVNVLPSAESQDNSANLATITEDFDLLTQALDEGSGINLNVSDRTVKKDITGAIIPSDGVTYNFGVGKLNDDIVIDTAGYQTITFQIQATSNFAGQFTLSGRNALNVPYGIVPCTALGAATVLTAAFTPSAGGQTAYEAPCLYRFIRLVCTTFTSGSAGVFITLKAGSQYPLGNLTALPVVGAGGSIGIAGNANATNSTGGTTISTGGVLANGGFAPGTGSITYPVMNGGRESPFTGALAGIVRTALVDSQGRSILGADYDVVRPRDPVTGLAQGPFGNAPVRGIGGRQNTMHGSQALLVEDVGQSEGDTTPTLLQQILVELKMLNQQINELPFTLNQGLHMQNEVAEYRTEEYNNHVNNQ